MSELIFILIMWYIIGLFGVWFFVYDWIYTNKQLEVTARLMFIWALFGIGGPAIFCAGIICVIIDMADAKQLIWQRKPKVYFTLKRKTND